MGKKVYEKELIEQVVKEAIETGNASIVARKHGISPKNVSYWVRTRKGDNAKTNFIKNMLEKNGLKETPQEYKQSLQQVNQLKTLLGERELEIAILRDLLKKTNSPLPQRLE